MASKVPAISLFHQILKTLVCWRKTWWVVMACCTEILSMGDLEVQTTRVQGQAWEVAAVILKALVHERASSSIHRRCQHTTTISVTAVRTRCSPARGQASAVSQSIRSTRVLGRVSPTCRVTSRFSILNIRRSARADSSATSSSANVHIL